MGEYILNLYFIACSYSYFACSYSYIDCLLFQLGSGHSVGSLLHAKNVLNMRKVNGKASKGYHDHSQFFDKVLSAYVVTGEFQCSISIIKIYLYECCTVYLYLSHSLNYKLVMMCYAGTHQHTMVLSYGDSKYVPIYLCVIERCRRWAD